MEEEARTWIGLMLGEPFGEGESFSDGLKSGVRLCRLANIVQPGSIPKFSLEPKMAIKERENITLFIQALKRFGIKDFECFSTLDLAEGQNTKAVVVAVHALGRLCQGPEYSAHEDWPKLGKQVLAKNTRVFTEKQLHEATAAVSVLNLGSSSMAKTAAASLLSGQAIAVSATTEAGAAGGSSAPSSSSAAAETVAATAVAAAAAVAATPAAAAPSASSSAAAAAPQATAAAQQDPAAPAGWLAKVSKSTGKTYYQHKATGKTVWTLPTEADA